MLLMLNYIIIFAGKKWKISGKSEKNRNKVKDNRKSSYRGGRLGYQHFAEEIVRFNQPGEINFEL